MKHVMIFLSALALVSCNTSIGVWRDTKVGYEWTKEKIQNSGNSGQQDYDYGAPVY